MFCVGLSGYDKLRFYPQSGSLLIKGYDAIKGRSKRLFGHERPFVFLID